MSEFGRRCFPWSGSHPASCIGLPLKRFHHLRSFQTLDALLEASLSLLRNQKKIGLRRRGPRRTVWHGITQPHFRGYPSSIVCDCCELMRGNRKNEHYMCYLLYWPPIISIVFSCSDCVRKHAFLQNTLRNVPLLKSFFAQVDARAECGFPHWLIETLAYKRIYRLMQRFRND